MMAGRLLMMGLLSAVTANAAMPGESCRFEAPCDWSWASPWFRLVGTANSSTAGPTSDANNNTDGQFLLLSLRKSGPKEALLVSPKYTTTGLQCRLSVMLNMANMEGGSFKVVIQMENTSVVIAERAGNNRRSWEKYKFNIGLRKQEFNIILEVVPSNTYPLHIALDNIELKKCFPEKVIVNECALPKFNCANSTVCINPTDVCDMKFDCNDGDDEKQYCDKVPNFARCSYETDLCGWHNSPDNQLLFWVLNNGSTPTQFTGPNKDHTFENTTGKYLYVDMTGKATMGSTATLQSPVINPPPQYHSNNNSEHYNSCYISFYYHQYGHHSGHITVFLLELIGPKENRTTHLWNSSGNKGDNWYKQAVILPNLTHRYIWMFEARRSFSEKGDLAIDDVSMSPKCFGIGVSEEDLDGYDYDTAGYVPEPTTPPKPHDSFANKTYYEFGTCNAKGTTGPKLEDCLVAYNNTLTQVTVLTQKHMAGIQNWTVPETGYYTLIGKGASGGKGESRMGISRASVLRIVKELYKGQHIYILIGQEGNSSPKQDFPSDTADSKNPLNPTRRTKQLFDKIRKMTKFHGGGGGGGATFVFTINKNRELVPLLVAAGGGGLAKELLNDDSSQHGHGINTTLLPVTGNVYGEAPAGAGGGWAAGNFSYRHETGLALLQGAIGGLSCGDKTGVAAGGFGGGGGGCHGGGGGGGYTGGQGGAGKSANGEGGYSWAGPGEMVEVYPGTHLGAGQLYIIPAVPEGCYCDYRCIALDEHRESTQCVCPPGLWLSNDMHSCLLGTESANGNIAFMVLLMATIAILILILGTMFVFLYNRYQRKKVAILRRKMVNGADMQLGQLRVQSDNMMTEYNPNYEFGGGTYTIRDLKDIPRDHLRLVKALGQGAFGEVYQGFFRHRAGDAVEMPVAVKRCTAAEIGKIYLVSYKFRLVALCRTEEPMYRKQTLGRIGVLEWRFVKEAISDTLVPQFDKGDQPEHLTDKTLPELSTNQAETDFLMEALIMSKFNHPNIVHFIGVCFDKHPRFIVIELLAGGDLKTFLRESRPKPDRVSPLVMKDLLQCAMDVAKGCKYMEDNRFIHRDIAARNCLLTTKGPGRVVKIADFGMARDIYRADYYRKGGKAMLPIKWMPPEAFLDGIFTSKTDVWSFGVLLWEVMSLGYMPYTGCANREVMQLVTSGGRLEPPSNCPSPLYGIMTQCWHPNPEERPTFATILERLGYCIQDPDVVKAPLPVFHRPPSTERDTTVTHPPNREQSIQPDYLVPLPGPNDWETSFASIPGSRSTQPLLSHSESGNISPANNNNNPSVEKQTSTSVLPPVPYVNVSVNHDDSGPFIVSAHILQDTEISC